MASRQMTEHECEQCGHKELIEAKAGTPTGWIRMGVRHTGLVSSGSSGTHSKVPTLIVKLDGRSDITALGKDSSWCSGACFLNYLADIIKVAQPQPSVNAKPHSHPCPNEECPSWLTTGDGGWMHTHHCKECGEWVPSSDHGFPWGDDAHGR